MCTHQCTVRQAKLNHVIISGLLSVHYAVHSFRYLNKWRRDPQLSFACCLALPLPLSDFQEEIGGLDETVRQTEEIEMPSIFAAVKDYGTVDSPVDADAKGGIGTTELKDANYIPLSCDKTRRHQETQTELFTPLNAHVDICEYSFRKYTDSANH